MAYNLGVDLGTTFVAAAVAQPNQVEMFTLGDRSVVAPAVVYRRDDGELVAGESASRRALSNPGRITREFKRRLGDPTPVTLGDRSYLVTELLATLLRDVLDKVTETEGAKPDRVVLTHPANWGGFRRGLFEEVPGMVGLTDVSLITEPEGAAAHYAATRQLTEGEIVAVYDLGGGTFDATVLRSRPDGVEILGIPEGIERLGGVDFDEAILAHVNYSADGALDNLDRRDPQTLVALARLRQDCVLAKEALSLDTETIIPVFLPGRHFDVRLTRAEFEDMIRAPIESSISALTRTLRSADVAPGNLSGVLLVGGSSRIPLVAKMVTEALGKPTVVDTHPKYAVALGAAAVARAQAGQQTLTSTGSGSESGSGSRSGSRAGSGRGGSSRDGGAGDGGAGRSGVAVLPPGSGGSNGSGAAAGSGAGGPGGGPGRSRRGLVFAGLAALVVLVILGTLLVNNVLRSGPGAAADQELAQSSAAVAPPDPSPPAVSVPIPSVGTPIPVGATPGFAEVSPNGRLLYVAGGNSKVVTVLDTSANRVIATVPIAAGPPQFLTFSPDGRRVYVSVFDAPASISAVVVLDTTTNQVIGQVKVPARPFRSAVSPDRRMLYVPSNDSSSVSVIDTASLKVTRQIPVPSGPHWVELATNGSRAFVADHDANAIGVLDVASASVVGQIPVGAGPHALAVHPTRPLLANANFDANSVTMIDTTTNRVAATIPVGKNPEAVDWSPDGRFAYAVNDGDNTVSVINASTDQVTATIPTGRTPTSIAVLPNGRQAYVTNLDSANLTVLNLGG
ncbi:MAG TPA: Hsp70 family protein [Pseudonocardia sp.]|nr:Hsp70 family protein [Pseudonocardia sp.]